MDCGVLVNAFQEAFLTWPEELDQLWSVQNQSPPYVNVYNLSLGEGWIFDAKKGSVIEHNGNTPRVRFNRLALP